MNMSKNKTNRFMPFIMAFCVVIGIIIGTFFSNHFSGNRLNVINSGSNRLNNLLHLIDDQYVDAVNIDSLVDKAIPLILAELDPHSVYISAKDAAQATDDLKGSFSGVGIEFVIRQDTIHVQNVIQNGPAEKAGLLAGDKIVAVDGKPFVGKIVTNQEAMHRLKGPKDTKVKIGVIRYGSKKVKTFTVTRGEIPTKSVTAAYMLNDKTGYIRIKNFGENTYPEMLIALAKLSQQGFTNLCIDLRDNSGGYLTAAVNMANEFLPDKKLIVYTQGRKSPRHNYMSDGKGAYQKIPMVVLINEGSASSAEIFAGAKAEELYHCGFEGMNITFTSDIKEALTDAKYIVNSGGAARKAGMTREDLLKGNAAIAEEFGKNVKAYCPDVKHIVVIFNPADITGLITLLYSGLKPSQVTTLAALDSTRLRSELSKHFGIAMDNVENCRTYGGHGEQMAVYASTAKVNGKALLDIIGTDALTKEQWTEIQQKVTKGGANIINLRGRSSFQSPSYVSIEMIAAAMGGKPFRWPAGTYVSNGKFDHIMMAWETSITKDGCHLKEVKGTPEEEAALEKSYAHLCALRDEVIAMGVLPPVSEWNKLNPYIK